MRRPAEPSKRRRPSAGLYLVATPIGNLGDITLRALEVLAAADVIACEDTRVTRKLADHFGIETPLTPYHEHNAAEARPKLLARLAAGEAVALVSDAGTPLISDPGYRLVREAQDAGLCRRRRSRRVVGADRAVGRRACRPTGSSSKASCRRKQAARQKRIAALARDAGDFGPVRERPAHRRGARRPRRRPWRRAQAAVCRELTKLHEEVRRGDARRTRARLRARRRDARRVRHRRRAAADDADARAADVDALLRAALARVSVKDAVGEVALATGKPKREVYQRALELSKGDEAMDPRKFDRRACARSRPRPTAPSRRRSGRRLPHRPLGRKPRRRAAGGEGLPHRRAALEKPGRRDRHRRARAARCWSSSRSRRATISTRRRSR